jgi:hypothetical protein
VDQVSDGPPKFPCECLRRELTWGRNIMDERQLTLPVSGRDLEIPNPATDAMFVLQEPGTHCVHGEGGVWRLGKSKQGAIAGLCWRQRRQRNNMRLPQRGRQIVYGDRMSESDESLGGEPGGFTKPCRGPEATGDDERRLWDRSRARANSWRNDFGNMSVGYAAQARRNLSPKAMERNAARHRN